MLQDCEYRGDVPTGNCGEPYPDYSDCYTQDECSGEDEDPCVTYGTGCNDPTPIDEQCDANAVYPEQHEFYAYIVTESPEVVTMESSESTVEGEIYTGSISWTVTSGPSWQIKADGEYGYSFKKIFDINTMTLQKYYNLYKYSTGNGYYTGWNNLIKSTYSTRNPTTNQVLNNNTPYAEGVSRVTGTIRHVMNVPKRAPFCTDCNLDITQNVDQPLKWSPK
jgi:hypothetical protein